LTWAEAEEIERKCNEAIYEATKVWVDVTMQQEGFVKETAAGVRENRGIPSDYKDVSAASRYPYDHASILITMRC